MLEDHQVDDPKPAKQSRDWHTTIDTAVLILCFGLMLVLLFLPGCQSYQPPGENLWLIVR